MDNMEKMMKLIMKEESFLITYPGVRPAIYWRKWYGAWAVWYRFENDVLVHEDTFPDGEVERLEFIYKEYLNVSIA